MSDVSEGPTKYVYWLAPTCNAGTPASGYTTTSAPGLATTYLWEWQVRIPPGHAGFTGIALIDSNNFILPYSQGAPSWLIGDDDLLPFPYGKQLGSLVTVATYNTGTFNHSWQLRFIYTPMSEMTGGEGATILSPDFGTWLENIGTVGE